MSRSIKKHKRVGSIRSITTGVDATLHTPLYTFCSFS